MSRPPGPPAPRKGSGLKDSSSGPARKGAAAGKPKAGSKQKAAVRAKRRPTRKARGGGLAGRLLRVMLIALSVGVLASGWLLWQITHYDPPNPVPQRQAAIVLGAALWNDRPSPGLQERLDQALRLYEAGRVDKLIVSGGLDRNGSKLTEAQGMRLYLVDKGVPKEDILLENRATSTYENLVFSREAGEKNGLSSYLIVTHEYHAPRALDMARFLGFDDPVVSSVKSKVLSASRNQTREVLAYGKWKLDKLLLLIGLKAP
ncbi:YdcF family protein [Paenibacillus pasadenensis]|uniref:Putative secreted protein associated with spyDAC n=1 Tax=Paenibacillus pasadenensis TaxID=217090 RepID=A0A2N5N666_9BACL|nr:MULTISPECIES: YdcF family protein [Paenibacillus]PLT45815.1 putative secreted protein associated with spyDAC [Paenibacillus pasadenensis]